MARGDSRARRGAALVAATLGLAAALGGSSIGPRRPEGGSRRAPDGARLELGPPLDAEGFARAPPPRDPS
jgi:hypothetical protein